MTARPISEAEIRRRKKIQGHISQTTGALGLTALTGAALASRGGRNTLRKVPQLKSRIKAPPPKDPDRDRIAAAVTPALATSAGIGGLGSFNFARYTAAEGKKKEGPPKVLVATPKQIQAAQKKPVVKSMGLEMGHYGEEGRPVVFEPIVVPVEKAWSPVASNFDPEAKRHRRSRAYELGLGGVAGGAAGAGILSAGKGIVEERKNKTPGQLKARHMPTVKAAQAVRHATAVKHGKVAAGLAGVTAVAGGGSELVRRKRTRSWKSYD